jgi:threonine/homoserine efflux transporter RhtA
MDSSNVDGLVGPRVKIVCYAITGPHIGHTEEAKRGVGIGVARAVLPFPLTVPAVFGHLDDVPRTPVPWNLWPA